MKIEKDRVVSVIYELRENNQDGRIIEALDINKPLTFIYGSGSLIHGFELNLFSKEKGDSFSFQLEPKLAYGDRREEMIINVPISVFEVDGKVDDEICVVGNEVPMMDQQGNQLKGIINEITDEHVVMDFNHPMAGVNLYFTGSVTEVREATEADLNPPSSCSSCGTGDSGCSGCGH